MMRTNFCARRGAIGRRTGLGIAAAMALWLGCAAPASASLTSATDRCFGRCPSLFGTSEMVGHDLSHFTDWESVMRRSRAQFAAARGVCSAADERDCVPRRWAALVDAVKDLPLRLEIARVNDALNQVPYVPTAQNWHRAMYWETPFEFLRYGGQCQDYAIAKYELLRQAGVPADLMRMVVLHDTAIDRDHAVLVVYVDGEAMVLDILNPAIVPADTVSVYRPYYSINENAWWYHFGAHSMAGWMTARTGDPR